jgi:MFS family permease
MPIWKRNLIVCWFGMFVSGVGMSMLAPVLPLYIQHLGVNNTASIAQLSGVAFGITYIISAIFSPIWGLAADKFGRKPMLLRASLGMAIVIGCMGFATNVYVLIGLRLLQGVITGYATACTTLIATQTDKEHTGYALGTISTASIAGSLLGPSISGFIEEGFGLQNVQENNAGFPYRQSVWVCYVSRVFRRIRRCCARRTSGSLVRCPICISYHRCIVAVNAVWVYFNVYKKLSIKEKLTV